MAGNATANPMLLLDELDKAGGSERHGHVHHALLSMLEPASAGSWYDQCLLAPCDLSQVSWIACANNLDPIPAALRSRFRVVTMPPPEPEHFDAVLASVIAGMAAGWEVAPAMLPDLPGRARQLLRERFARDRSVRMLARNARALIGAVLADSGGPRRQ